MSKFVVGERIGSGAFGEVFSCTKGGESQTFAMKRLLPNGIDEDLKRFEREVRIQSTLRHRHVVPIIAYEMTATPPWCVMPKAEKSLRDHLKTHHGELELWIFEQVAEGVRNAHENGIVHRDLKPENVLFFHDGGGETFVAISDFGLGRHLTKTTKTLTMTRIGMGTIEYVAPEQYQDAKKVDHRADIYSLGKLLYEILTGEMPYPTLELELVPAKYRHVVQKACKANPVARFTTVAEMIQELRVLSSRQHLATQVAEIVRKEAQALVETKKPDKPRVGKLLRLLIENADDKFLMKQVLPHLPSPVVDAMSHEFPEEFLTLLREFDKAIDGTLAYEYCDVVAVFYERICGKTNSNEVRELILRRLAPLGFRHSRWMVGSTFARLTAAITDEALIPVVREILHSDIGMAAWLAPYFDTYSQPVGVREALREMGLTKPGVNKH